MTRTARRIAVIYLVAASLWIVLSDWLLLQLGPVDFALGPTARGLLFVASTALLIYLLARREVEARRLTEAERTQLERRLAAAVRLEAMGKLTGGISHDFNNLLTAISGNIEAFMTQHSDCDHGLLELEEARDAADRAAELTRQLLAFGRPQLDEPERVDPNAVILNMSALLGRLISGGVRIETDLDDDLDPIHMDPGRLEQVVMNLAINARDAMPAGGTLRLSTSRVVLTREGTRRCRLPVEPGPYVRLEVADTGGGMPASIQAEIFEPFFTTKPRGVGSGLGLSTVRSIVSGAGGHVSVSSAPGSGSTFTVLLPEATTAGDQPIAIASGIDAPVAARGTEQVLVAEDDPAVRSLIVRILRRRGFEVVEAPNGQVALDLLSAPDVTVDILISDVQMPEMSGLDLVAAGQALRPELKVLLISGSPDDEAAAAVPYLAKPFTAAQLTDRMRELLDD